MYKHRYIDEKKNTFMDVIKFIDNDAYTKNKKCIELYKEQVI